MIEVYACDFSGNGVFVMFIADLLQTRRATTSKSRPGFTGIGPTHNALMEDVGTTRSVGASGWWPP
jgi:hypothetical protein